MKPGNEDIRVKGNSGKARLAGGAIRLLKGIGALVKKNVLQYTRGCGGSYRGEDSGKVCLAAAGSIWNGLTFSAGVRACAVAGRLAGRQFFC